MINSNMRSIKYIIIINLQSISANIYKLFKYLASISSMNVFIQTFNLKIDILSIVVKNSDQDFCLKQPIPSLKFFL